MRHNSLGHDSFMHTCQQVVFSAIFYFNTIAIYSGWLVVGYSTLYTMFPVFSLVFDEDVDVETGVTLANGSWHVNETCHTCECVVSHV